MRLKLMRRTCSSMRFEDARRGTASEGGLGCSEAPDAGGGGSGLSPFGTGDLVEHGYEAWIAVLAGSRTWDVVLNMFTMAGKSEVEKEGCMRASRGIMVP